MNPIERVYTVTECRELDRIAVEELGIPGFELMKRAGQFAYERLQANFPSTERIKVYSGSGNNAGDSYVLAGLAHREGVEVTIVQITDPIQLQGDARAAWDWMVDQGVDVGRTSRNTPDVIVDGLLGTGAKGSVRDNYQAAIADINSERSKTLALDLPSGLNSSTGSLLCREPVHADLTCTFVGAKVGLFTGSGPDFAGRVEFSNLSLPSELYARVGGLRLLNPREPGHYLPPRKATSHKGQAGRVLVVGGDLGSGGAAILTAEAALRTGAGLVTAVSRPEHVGAFLARCPEVMVHGLSNGDDVLELMSNADVVALGPGLSSTDWSQSMVATVLNENPRKLIVDAGALRLLANRRLPEGCIITPHPGEAGGLLGVATKQVQEDRVSAISNLTQSLQCTAILKGAGSLIASKGEPIALLRCANPALATAGSGDVLTGIAAAAYAVLERSVDAAETAVILHSRAGLAALESDRKLSIVASDLVNNIRPREDSE
ncbi:MAG: NAD(P)H-hydrate dehydratase [Gammaproteobacteria bacterium]|nr:NAD(P)H-hydrate dehydratase [Gammaproteobacteria bacterium]